MSPADDVAREAAHGAQALAAARALFGLRLFNDALARTYYAAFHFATALLLTEGVEPRRHRSLPGLLASHLGGAGFDASDAARLGRLSTYRDMADYERAFDATEGLVQEALADAETFIAKAERCLRDRGFEVVPQR
ncbi:MAG: HEPN domain-containing protein [Polyangiaceae bacterium]|nr:HEPN domain-containing protein [Polyangiaceae bacterium]MBK8939557.1 HEPN domain-containing protein [Polyangiaceae bacterium]